MTTTKELLLLLGVTLVALSAAFLLQDTEAGTAVEAGVSSEASPTGRAAGAPADESSSAPTAARSDGVATEIPARVAATTDEAAARGGFRITGRIVDARSGAPLPGVEVTRIDAIANQSNDGTPASEATEATATDSDGVYAFHGVHASVHELVARREGFGTRVHRYVQVLEDGPDVVEQDLELAPGASIAGRVIDLGGSGVAGLELRASGHAEGRVGRGRATTDESGAFVLADLVDGNYTVQLASAEWAAEPAYDVATGTDSVEIVAVTRGRIRGRVSAAGSGEALSAFELVLRDAHPTDVVLSEEISRRSFEGTPDA